MEDYMDKNIGVCGLDCSNCNAYKATVNNDNLLRQETAEKWTKEYNHDFKPEEINCLGCNSQGPYIEHCFECPYRLCAKEKGLTNCGQCEQYPCEKIAKFHEHVPQAKQNCDLVKA
jgi:hypothetical protein